MAFIQKISFDALVGPDSSTWEWQEEMGDKILVEKVVRDMLEKVVEDAERLPVARVLFAEDEDSEDLSDIEVSEEDISESEYFNWIDTQRGEFRRCEVCFQNEWTIRERIITGEGEPVDTLSERDGRLVCGCCQEMRERPFSEYSWCSNCFLSEKMGRRYGISMVPIEGNPVEHVCSVCNDIYPDLSRRDEEEEETSECPPFGTSCVWEQRLDGSWIYPREYYEEEEEEYEETYMGEFENEDPPENNAELAVEIKGAIAEIGENLFDVKEKLTEGEYLKMMDLLQKVTNDVNRL